MTALRDNTDGSLTDLSALSPSKPLAGQDVSMKALVYRGVGEKAVEDRPRPQIIDNGDAIVRVTRTTICGTDLHILKGDVPS